ncbi:hypothetical protein AB1Y20_021205 [Prymnesium parvum]|uniref:Phosphoglycerate mutase n=1 Tax=Prymnesium parvum TaxID=97485 RepID=A0AB34JJG7_PRYPA
MSVSRSRKPPPRLLRVSHATFASQSISTAPPSALARTMAHHVLLLSSALLLPSRPPLRVEATRRAPSRACVLSIAERERAVATLAIVRPAELEEAECELNHLDFCDMENGRIVLLRHGESEWNAGLPRFTGWSDVGLSARGVEQAAAAGRILLDHEVCFEQVHVSNLKRTIKTAWTVLEAMDTFTVPIVQSWRLNERMYGALTGLDKVATERVLGEAGFEELRLDPPPLDDENSCFDPSRNPAFRSVPAEALPKKESFADTRGRVLPYWEEELLPKALSGQDVLIVSSKNLLRSLFMAITDLPEQVLLHLDIPNCQPLMYDPKSQTLQLMLPGGKLQPWPLQPVGQKQSQLTKEESNILPNRSYFEGRKTGQDDLPGAETPTVAR